MARQATTPIELQQFVPVAVLEATRSLLWLRTGAEARRIAEALVRGLGGTIVAADTHDENAIPADLAFGDGEPQLAAAPPGSAARVLLEQHLATFLEDARRALLLSGRTERLAESASTDVLTGLPNRRMLSRALGRLADDDTVIMMDLDHFKRINDHYGHPAGDDVLRAFGEVLHETVRGRDAVGRFGGEEFLVILAPPADADIFLRRLRTDWSARRPYAVTFSAGIARSAGDREETLRLADEALYRAKAQGRDRWVWSGAGPNDHCATDTTKR